MKRARNGGASRATAQDHPNRGGPGTDRVPLDRVLAAARELYAAGEPPTYGAIANALGGISRGRVEVFGEAIGEQVRAWLDDLIRQPLEDNAARRSWIGKALTMRRFWTATRSGDATAGQRDAIGRKYVGSACDILLSEGLTGYDTPTPADFQREFGFWPQTENLKYRNYLREYLDDLGFVIYKKYTKHTPENAISLSDVLTRIDPKLHFIPLTHLDDPKKYSAPRPRLLSRIYNIPCRSVRHWTFLHAMIRPNLSFSHFTGMMSKITRMAAVLGYDRDADLQNFDFESHWKMYLNGAFTKVDDGETPGSRYGYVSSYFTALSVQDEWLRKLTETQRKDIARFILPKPNDDYFFRSSYI